MLWLNILECFGSVPRELLNQSLESSELGILSKIGEYFFLHQPKDSLLPTHRDWNSQVLEDLEDIQIEINLNDVAEISKERFKNIKSKHIKKMHSLNSLKRRTNVYLNMQEESLLNMKI